MEKRYQRLVRKIYRYFRHRKRRKHAIMGWFSRRVFDRHLWKWERKSVATGIALGAICSILPVPMQTLFAAAACLWRRANIPTAVVMTWLSPPGSFLLIIPVQGLVGHFILQHTGFDVSSLKIIDVLHFTKEMPWVSIRHDIQISGKDFIYVIRELFLGIVVTCVGLAALCYGITQLIWHAIRLWRWKRYLKRSHLFEDNKTDPPKTR